MQYQQRSLTELSRSQEALVHASRGNGSPHGGGGGCWVQPYRDLRRNRMKTPPFSAILNQTVDLTESNPPFATPASRLGLHPHGGDRQEADRHK